MELNQITETIIGAAIEVHRRLGPGLLESSYRRCLCRERTYMKLGGWQVGLLLNFNVTVLKEGIKRRVLNLPE
jgi:hypothetical protein